MKSFASLLAGRWPTKSPARRSADVRSTRPISGWWAIRVPAATSRTAATSSRRRRRSCARILIDNARRKHARKRGGDLQRQPLDAVAAPEPDENLLALDEALKKLAAKDPDKAKLVELRYFAGLSADQAAEVLGISPSTADRHWAYALRLAQGGNRRLILVLFPPGLRLIW